MTTQGRRVEIVGDILGLEPGDYAKDSNGLWWARVPSGLPVANLGGHEVAEHDDGTITVSPSILMEHWSGKSWHGYLEHGVWREV